MRLCPALHCSYGAQEYIEHGKTGWIYPSGNLEKLVACIEESKDDALIQTMHMNCLKSGNHNEYSSDTHIERLLGDYERILSGQETFDRDDRRQA